MKKSPLVPIALLLLTMALAIGILSPLIEEDSRLEGEVEDRLRQTTQMQQSLETTKALHERFTRLSELDRQKMIASIPDTLDQQSVIAELTSIAAKHSLLLSSITFSKHASKDSPKKVTILAHFSSPGDTNLAVPLLQSLEAAERLYTVQGLSFLLNKNRSDYSLTLETYYQT